MSCPKILRVMDHRPPQLVKAQAEGKLTKSYVGGGGVLSVRLELVCCQEPEKVIL